jgi:iron complex outermembrane receptor protein
MTWRTALDHKFNDDIMAYVSYNRGFKSGLFNNVNPTQKAVYPEVLDAYEVGLKTELFDKKLRLNAAAFYYSYTNIQIQEILAGSQLTLNAAAAHIKGADADFEFRPIRNLSFQGGVSFLDGRYTNFPNAPHLVANPLGGDTQTTLVNAAGYPTVHTPKFTGDLAATYKIPSSVGDFALSGSYAYNSGFSWFPDDSVRQPAYSLVSAALEWKPLDRSWGVRLWGHNLTGAKYYSYATETTLGNYGSPAAPTTFGITLSKHFQ